MGDSNNKRPDLPELKIEKSGRISLSIYKMTGGYIAIDDETNKKFGLTSLDDIRQTIDSGNTNVMEHVRRLLNDAKEEDFVCLTIIVETKSPEDFMQITEQIQEPDPLNLNQLTDMINDIINSGTASGVPGMSPFGRKVMITPQMINNYMQSNQYIKIKTVPRDASNGRSGEPNANTKGKDQKFYHQGPQGGGNKQPQGNNGPQLTPGEPKPTKLD